MAGGKGPKAKGAGYERELAAWLNERVGIASRRALLSGGGRNDGGADLDDTPGLHVEAKRTEAVNVKAAMRQAEESISRGKRVCAPVVITRQNRMTTDESLVVMRLADWAGFYAAWLEAGNHRRGLVPVKDGFELLLERSQD